MHLQVCQPGCSSSQTCNQCDTFSKQVGVFCDYPSIFGCASISRLYPRQLVIRGFKLKASCHRFWCHCFIVSWSHQVIRSTCQLLKTFLNPWKLTASLGNPIVGNFLLMFGHLWFFVASSVSIRHFCIYWLILLYLGDPWQRFAIFSYIRQLWAPIIRSPCHHVIL